jgi:nascent polypeptide-associated complex subunit alpha
MFPGMNPRDVQKAMKRLGISQQVIEAEEVIIKAYDRDILIRNPQVSKVNMMGQETFQIVGEITEVLRTQDSETDNEDLLTLMEQTNCTRDEAIQSLADCNGNLAEAILKLQKK